MQGPIMIGISELKLNFIEKKLLTYPIIGGVILFARNFQSVGQLKELIETIQALRDQANLPSIIIAIDHEGGTVQRLRGDGFTNLPSAEEIGRIYHHDATKALSLIKQLALVTAYELGRLGIDICLAPVLDFAPKESVKMSSRCYGRDPISVTQLAKEYITELQASGLTAFPKHFPGIGNDVVDTHYKISISDISLDELMQTSIRPYQTLIQSGLLKAIVLSHRIYSKVDRLPPTCSKKWLKQILRNQLKFDGLIMTDCLQMASAAIMGLDLKTRMINALKSGCDIILCSHVCDGHYKEFHAALSDQKLEQVILQNEALRSSKIMKIKQQYSTHYYQEKLESTEYKTAVKNILEFHSKNEVALCGPQANRKTIRSFLKKTPLLRTLKSSNALNLMSIMVYRFLLVWTKLKQALHKFS